MDYGWDNSAVAWITALGQRGDWNREHVLDPVMLSRVEGGGFRFALDVGCGEGRFCRLMQQRGIETVGVDPTVALLEEAKKRDPSGNYRVGTAEKLEFDDGSFDLVVSYLTLTDIPEFRTAIGEMSRVLRIGGSLLIANLTSFTSACSGNGWMNDQHGRPIHYPVDRYLDEFRERRAWDGIKIYNWHRPLSAYMTELLNCGLVLRFFEEPEPTGGDPERASIYRRAPLFMVMEWAKQKADLR